MQYRRMPIEIEAPEERGYATILNNLAESSIRDLNMRDLDIDLKNLTLFYGEHRGMVKLREAILEDSAIIKTDDVLVTAGAATALFITATTLLGANDHIVVIRPNYGTNLETPRAINCQMSIVDLNFEEGFEINTGAIRRQVRPNTNLISVTNPHNPSGKLFNEQTMNELTSLAEEKNCFLLVDETYRDLNFKTELKPYAAEQSEHVISVSSVSKSYGAPGIRIGWIICRNKKLMADFLAAKEQISLCNSVVDEEIAFHLLSNKKKFMEHNHRHIRANFALLHQWFATQSFLEWVEPQAGVVCFPRFKANHRVEPDKFYNTLYDNYRTIVGPGHWFERDKIYMRIGFGYPTTMELKGGLACLEACFKEVRQ
jgi:aspartate/methionine/tyrosine aminotransferase